MKNSFIQQLKESKASIGDEVFETSKASIEKVSDIISHINEAKEQLKSSEEILRDNKIKIKNRILTDFGTQFELFKKPNKDDLKKLFKADNLYIKGNFIFIFEQF
jgi:hypothetical protein